MQIVENKMLHKIDLSLSGSQWFWNWALTILCKSSKDNFKYASLHIWNYDLTILYNFEMQCFETLYNFETCMALKFLTVVIR